MIIFGGSTGYIGWFYVPSPPLNDTWALNLGASESKATIVTPAPGSTLSGTSSTFTWNPGLNASAYWLDVNSSCTGCGGGIFGGNEGLATSQTVTGLPVSGGTIYVRLWTQIAGTWQFNDYTYIAASLGSKASILSPSPGRALSGSSVSCTWSPGTGATAYWLDVGTVQGQGNIFGQNVGLVTTQTVNGIPAGGGTIYVRL